MPLPATTTSNRWRSMSADEIEQELLNLAERLYDQKEEDLGSDLMRQVERWVMLRTVDNLWVRHLTDLDVLREGIGLRAFGQQDPLVSFKREAHDMYNQLLAAIQHDIAHAIYHARVAAAPQRRQMRAVHPSSEGGDGARKPIRSKKLPGRNDPCWCGSGKKYKHCHLRQDKESGQAGGSRSASQPAKSKQTSYSRRQGRR
jgi:preprotein translocase subunit SecA